MRGVQPDVDVATIVGTKYHGSSTVEKRCFDHIRTSRALHGMTEISEAKTGDVVYRFGAYELMARRHLLAHDSGPVRVGSRSLAILTLLVERAGELVTKEELMAAGWPDVFVHEANLKVTVSNLRRALGDTAPRPTYVATVPGRGYRFIAQVARQCGDALEMASTPALSEVAQLPEERIIFGRSREIEEVVVFSVKNRLVTLVGPAGVGKTTIAVTAARRLQDAFPDGVCFVDLSVIQHERLVPILVASALGARGNPIDVTTGVAELIANRKKLIVLDNCEHVLPGVRGLISRILGSTTGSQILTTSRERLGVSDEILVQIQALPVPEPVGPSDLEDALGYASVALFLARAREWADFTAEPSQTGTISAICRSLDGLPLALEIGAAQLDRYRPEELLAKLSEHLASFDNRNVGAPPRQRTLWAAFDWSYRLLSLDEAFIFRALSVFAGSFDLEDVLGVLGPLGFDPYRVTVGLGVLVAKSLVAARVSEDGLSYRLLDSARMYTAAQAKTDAQLDSVQKCYAIYLVSLIEKAEQEWIWKDAIEWRNLYGPRLNDLRQALDWCFGRGSRPDLGFRLAVSALPLWDEFSASAESRTRVQQAWAYADRVGADEKSIAKLLRARAFQMLSAERIAPESVQAWNTAIDHAQRNGDVDGELHALWGFAVYLSHTGHHESALNTLGRFRDLASGSERLASISDGEWVHALSEVYLGKLESARAKLELLANDHPLVAHRSCAGIFSISKAMQLRTQLSFLLWLMGQPERALRVMDDVYSLPEQTNHVVSQICHIVWSCLPLSLWARDLQAASKFLMKLRSYLEVENIPIWQPIRLFHQADLDHRQGNADAVKEMQNAIDRIIDGNMVARAPMYLNMLAHALVDRGDLGCARMTLQRATAAARNFEERWIDPELLRTSAALAMAEGDEGDASVKLHEATCLALKSGANFLALLAANDLAEMHLNGRRPAAARDALQPVFSRFTGGFGGAEVVRASRLLQEAEAGML